MIATTLTDGQEVRILFRHNDFKKQAQEIARELGVPSDIEVSGVCRGDRRNKQGEEKFYTHSTLCDIVVGPKDAEVSLGQGESWCAVGDNFCRATGREYALKRAIENGGFGREDTGNLLAAYFNRPTKRTQTVTK